MEVLLIFVVLVAGWALVGALGKSRYEISWLPTTASTELPAGQPQSKRVARSEIATELERLGAMASKLTVTGPAFVVDGDGLYIGDASLRLAGVDAPEQDQPYGINAKQALIRLCQGNEVRAVLSGGRSHGRFVATCYLPDGRDLGAELVKIGLALDWPKYSGGKYRHLEPDGVRRRLWRCDARQKGRMPPRSMPD